MITFTSAAAAYVAIGVAAYMSFVFYYKYKGSDELSSEPGLFVHVLGCAVWPVALAIALVGFTLYWIAHWLPAALAEKARSIADRHADKRRAKLEALRQAVSSAEKANANLKIKH